MAKDKNGNEVKYSFGLWTVNWAGGDPFGAPTRPWNDYNFDSIRKLKEIGAHAFTFHDDDAFPPTATDAERSEAIAKLKKVINETGIVCEMTPFNGFSHPVFKEGGFISSNREVRRYGLIKTLRHVDLAAELGATTFVLWNGREGAEYDNSKDLGDAHARYAEAIDTVADYIKAKGYDIRIALEPKPNEPRGDMLLPTIGHALAVIDSLDNSDIVGLNPEVGHEQMANLNFTHGIALAMYLGKLFHIDLNGQNGAKFDQDLVFGHGDLKEAFFLVDLLNNGGINGNLQPYTGYRHFDYKPSRTESDAGVWESARANIEIYETLSKKAENYRKDPKTIELFKRAKIDQLGQPTLAAGESVVDFRNSVSQYDFDIDTIGKEDYGLVELHQQAIRHILG